MSGSFLFSTFQDIIVPSASLALALDWLSAWVTPGSVLLQRNPCR